MHVAHFALKETPQRLLIALLRAHDGLARGVLDELCREAPLVQGSGAGFD
jgi:hypothetical protein